jgi:hypothetical protein
MLLLFHCVLLRQASQRPALHAARCNSSLLICMLRGMARAICLPAYLLPPPPPPPPAPTSTRCATATKSIVDSFAAAATAAPDRRYYWSQPCRLSL